MKKIIIYGSITLFIILILYFLWPDDSKRIKTIIHKGQGAVENESIEEVMSLISFHYKDDAGQTYFILKRNLQNLFNQISDIEIEYRIIEIKIKNNTATASLGIRVIGTLMNNRGYIIGNFDSPEEFTLALEKEHLKWFITGSEGIKRFYLQSPDEHSSGKP